MNQSPAQTAEAARELQQALGDKLLHVELGNEVYDCLGKPYAGANLTLFPDIASYAKHIAPALAVGGVRFAVPVPPCPAFYNQQCWGGPTTWLAGWYRNMSKLTKAAAVSGDAAWQTVTAHHYRPRPLTLDCTPFRNCSYELAGDEVQAADGTRQSSAVFAATMLAFPQVRGEGGGVALPVCC